MFARHRIFTAFLLALVIIVLMIWWRFQADMASAHARTQQGSTVIASDCGPIEYADSGAGIPLLVAHGSGGGFDMGMAVAAPLLAKGIRVIAVSRFGYLRTPMPANASAEAQSDAYVCLLDALGIRQAAILGGSAGASSALELAIRHPDRVNALILLAPVLYKPPNQTVSATPMAPWLENAVMAALGSDFLFWSASHLMPGQMIKLVLATPPEVVAGASEAERARISAVLTAILPVSSRIAGLRSDTAASKNLTRAALGSVHTPTLLISARDDGYGTYADAEYTASQIAGAKFIGFDAGGHLWVGHDDAVMAAIAAMLIANGGVQKP